MEAVEPDEEEEVDEQEEQGPQPGQQQGPPSDGSDDSGMQMGGNSGMQQGPMEEDPLADIFLDYFLQGQDWSINKISQQEDEAEPESDPDEAHEEFNFMYYGVDKIDEDVQPYEELPIASD